MTKSVPFSAKLSALVRLRCPVCRVGPMFRTPIHMHARCPHCDYPFDKGNGYFLGAMYASYGLSLAVCGAQTIACILAGAPTWLTTVAAIVTACIVGPCFAFPYSRCAWVWAEREGHLHDGEEDVLALQARVPGGARHEAEGAAESAVTTRAAFATLRA